MAETDSGARTPGVTPHAIGYWAATAVLALVMAGGGVMDLLLPRPVVDTLTHLGYPLYLGRLLGVLKLLGTIALLAPGLPLLKEWAYAGFAFDLIGAAVSHAAVGDGPAQVGLPLGVLAVAAASYLLRPASRRLDASPHLSPGATSPG